MATIKTVRRLLLLFIAALFLSGATAIPVAEELAFLLRHVPQETSLHRWLERVLAAYRDVNAQYSFLLYGYDWLAFAHFVLALLFVGPYRDPVRNIWVVQFGLLACVLVIPFAFLAGHFRGIPPGWQLIDCCFGAIGFSLLFVVHKKIKSLINN